MTNCVYFNIYTLSWSLSENKLDIITKQTSKVNRHEGILYIAMYLATFYQDGSLRFCIRQSYLAEDAGYFTHRDIFDLGPTPADHFELWDNGAVVFSTRIQSAVEKYSRRDGNSILESLLSQFFPAETRKQLNRFKRNSYTPPQPLSKSEVDEIEKTIHIFDRRRLYYLYYGGLDQSRLYRMHEKLCKTLLYKSRDEREYTFREMEKSLKPGEYQNYIYAIFNLQAHFNQSFAAFLPEALPRDDVADHFSSVICELNRDSRFWYGTGQSDSLHPHLQRYLIMFFDYIPEKRSFADEFIRNFINSHRKFRWPEPKPQVSEDKIRNMFSTSYADLKKMDKKDLTRLFRKKAMELHPDQGGDHDRFVELSDVYRTLMQKKE